MAQLASHAWVSPFRHGAYTPIGAYRAAVLSRLAYEDHDARQSWLMDQELYGGRLISLESGNSQGFVLFGGDHACVVVRGTSLGELGDLLDDADIRRVPLCGGRFHRGFYRYANRLAEPMMVALSGSGVRTLSFHGHSLGAAAAVSLASWHDSMTSSVWLFGCPHVGDRRFVRDYDARLGRKTFSHQNNNDPVCWAPLTLKRVGMKQLRYFTHDGRLILRPRWYERLRDAKRGAIRSLWDIGLATADHAMQGKSLVGSLSAAIQSQMSEFDHAISSYVRLTGCQPYGESSVKEYEA